MKQKTSKLLKLERNRKSILTEDLEHCYICGRPKNDLHEVYGGANRRVSMANGFVVPICRECHRQVTENKWIVIFDEQIYLSEWLKKHCQKKFEETHSRAEFMKLIRRNYL